VHRPAATLRVSVENERPGEARLETVALVLPAKRVPQAGSESLERSTTAGAYSVDVKLSPPPSGRGTRHMCWRAEHGEVGPG
jgi:hypothetical protein